MASLENDGSNKQAIGNDVQKEVNIYEDEINLREYIQVIVKRSKLIIGIFLVAVVAAAIYNLFLPKVYQASASIMIMPSRIQSALSPTSISLVTEKDSKGEYTGQRPAISIATHEVLLKSSIVLERVITKLKTKDNNQEDFTIEGLSGSLKVENLEETNILKLTATGIKPVLAIDIVNIWADEYARYSAEIIRGEVGDSGDFVVEQFDLAEKNLVKAEMEVKNFKDQYQLNLMQAELKIKKGKLNREKGELANSEIVLKTKEDSLKQLETELEKQERFIVVSKAITDDILWQDVIKGSGAKDLDKKKLRSEKLNPIYQELETRLVNTKIELNTLRPKIEHLRRSIKRTDNEISILAKEVNEIDFKLTLLTRQVAINKKNYNDLSGRVYEARIAKALELGEVKIVSEAFEPRFPIAPNRRKNVAIAGVVSLAIGVFMAFCLEFWQKSEDVKKSQAQTS